MDMAFHLLASSNSMGLEMGGRTKGGFDREQ